MKFALGKSKLNSSSSLEEETINRWRSAALKTGDAENTAPAFSLDYDKRDYDKPQWPSEFEMMQAAPLVSRHSVKAAPSAATKISPGVQPQTEEDLKQRLGGKLRAALGAGTVIQGRLTFDTPVRIDGNLTGEVSSTSTLVVGEQGSIRANIQVGSLIIFGHVVGPVEANALVEIRKGGRLEGNIQTDRLAIEAGGVFNGDCYITRLG